MALCAYSWIHGLWHCNAPAAAAQRGLLAAESGLHLPGTQLLLLGQSSGFVVQCGQLQLLLLQSGSMCHIVILGPLILCDLGAVGSTLCWCSAAVRGYRSSVAHSTIVLVEMFYGTQLAVLPPDQYTTPGVGLSAATQGLPRSLHPLSFSLVLPPSLSLPAV